MPPFAECQDRYDDSFVLTKPKPKSNDYDIMTNESIAATDVSVTSKVSSFYEKLMDFNLCCTHDQAEISLPNDNDNENKVQEESKEEIIVEQEKVIMGNNNNMEQGTNDDDEQTHQLVKTISMDILMKKAEEADRHNKAVAERYESTSEKSVSVVGASDDDEGTISTKDNSQHEEKKLVISKNLEKKTTDQSKSLRKNLEAESMTGKKPSLFVRGKEFVLVKKKNNKNKGTNKLSTKKKRWSTKYTKKLLPMKKTEVVVISERDGMLLNGKQKSSTMMKRIKKSMSFPKIKNNRTKNDVSSDDKKKASKVKRIMKSMPFPKIKSNRTTINELPSNEKKKKSSMVKRIKKSMAFKKVNNNRSMSSSNLSSSNQKKKKSSMVKSIKKSLSLKKVKSIRKSKNEASLPANKKKKKTSSMMMKNGKKSFSFKKKISKDKCQDDADRAGSSSFEE